MKASFFRDELLAYKESNSYLKKKNLNSIEIQIYPRSVQKFEQVIFFIAKDNIEKYLFLYYDDPGNRIAGKFKGNILTFNSSENFLLKRCIQNTYNREMLQECFDFTRPRTIGLADSFGFGDRLGLANPAHIRSLESSNFKPILAQQSIRELTRTNRTPSEVMDASAWAVFQEGYKGGFGADADHLKTKEDIDLMVRNGFKMFTFDPSEYVHNEADTLPDNQLDNRLKSINWEGLKVQYKSLADKYLDKEFKITGELIISTDENKVKRALIKYGDALAYIKKLYDYLRKNHAGYESEVEVSVDETDSVTSPFEHFFIATELKRLDVKLISLAPRFIGDFEKGIDYKGDLELFKQEYIKHISIANYFGTYKLSLHSGSDKFGVYRVIGSLKIGVTHVKTAGTSYLEGLKVLAEKEPAIFREMLDYCKNLYDAEKKTYHVSADINNVKPAKEYTDKELIGLFNQDDWRQILHVTFGRVLADKNKKGEYVFKDKLFDCLKKNEETHYNFIINHFHKHLEPFN